MRRYVVVWFLLFEPQLIHEDQEKPLIAGTSDRHKYQSVQTTFRFGQVGIVDRSTEYETPGFCPPFVQCLCDGQAFNVRQTPFQPSFPREMSLMAHVSRFNAWGHRHSLRLTRGMRKGAPASELARNDSHSAHLQETCFGSVDLAADFSELGEVKAPSTLIVRCEDAENGEGCRRLHPE